MLLIGAKTFIVRGTILIPLISHGHLITIADNDNDIDTADDDNNDDDDDDDDDDQ